MQAFKTKQNITGDLLNNNNNNNSQTLKRIPKINLARGIRNACFYDIINTKIKENVPGLKR